MSDKIPLDFDTQAPAPESGETGVTVDLPEHLDASLNELFNRNPLKWTSADRDQAIQHLRKSREIFAKEEAQAKTKGRKTNAKKALMTKGASNITLGDLGLDL